MFWPRLTHLCILKMSLYKYFTSNVKLPDPTNAPSTLPQSSIAAANKEVKKLLSQPGASEKSRGSYDKYTIEQRTAISMSVE